MSGIGTDKDSVEGMLLEINQLLEQLEKKFESSFKILRSDLLEKENKKMESLEKLISNVENMQLSLMKNKSDEKTIA